MQDGKLKKFKQKHSKESNKWIKHSNFVKVLRSQSEIQELKTKVGDNYLIKLWLDHSLDHSGKSAYFL